MVAIKQSKYAIHSLVLPVSSKKVEFRPWNMREQAILLMAYASEDKIEIRRAIKQIITNIIQGDFNIGEMPVADMEFLFIRARARSVGEMAEITLENQQKKETKKIQIDLTKIEVTITKDRNYTIPLLDAQGKDTGTFFVMKEPTVSILEDLINMKNPNPTLIDDLEVAAKCVDKVGDKDNLTDAAEQFKEIKEYIEGMTPVQYKPIDLFLAGMPKLRHEVSLASVFPGMSGKYVLEGLDSFFE